MSYEPATISPTIVDAKGDLIVASGADAVSRLAVGVTNGHVLTVDSTQSLGVKWAAQTGGSGPTWVYTTSNQTVTNTTTLQDSTDLQFAVTSGNVYEFEMRSAMSWSATCDMQHFYTGPTLTTGIIEFATASTPAGTTSGMATTGVAAIYGGWPASAYVTSTTGSSTNYSLLVTKGVFKPSANGTVKFQFAQNALNNGATVVQLAGSWLRYQQIA